MPFHTMPCHATPQVFLLYHFEREVQPAVKRADWERRPFGAHMDVARMVAAQTRIERQDSPHTPSASFDFAAANAFQLYVSSAIAFSIKRGGILYGTGAAQPAAAVRCSAERCEVVAVQCGAVRNGVRWLQCGAVRCGGGMHHGPGRAGVPQSSCGRRPTRGALSLASRPPDATCKRAHLLPAQREQHGQGRLMLPVWLLTANRQKPLQPTCTLLPSRHPPTPPTRPRSG